jgi:predicted DNA-binding transcriptional regulator AlpA
MSRSFVRINQLATVTGLSTRTIRTLMEKRAIPYIRTGHRTVLYDPAKVIAAIEKFEVQPVA